MVKPWKGWKNFFPIADFFPKEKHSFKIGGVLAIFWCFFLLFLGHLDGFLKFVFVVVVVFFFFFF